MAATVTRCIYVSAQVGSNLNDVQLQQLVDRTIIQGDKDKDGKLSYEVRRGDGCSGEDEGCGAERRRACALGGAQDGRGRADEGNARVGWVQRLCCACAHLCCVVRLAWALLVAVRPPLQEFKDMVKDGELEQKLKIDF